MPETPELPYLPQTKKKKSHKMVAVVVERVTGEGR